MTPPKIQRVGARLFVQTAAGAIELVPSHADRAQARWWRCVSEAGAVLSPWVGCVRVAAAWAVATAS